MPAPVVVGSVAKAGIGSSLMKSIGSSIGAILGGSVTGIGSVMNNKRQYHWQRDLLHLQNELNQYNAQHSHQWEVEDLRAAGLNPILSATGGDGATASASAAPQTASSDPVSVGVNSVLALKQLQNETALRKAQEADYRSSINSREYSNHLMELQGEVERSKVHLNNSLATKELANAEFIRNQAIESGLRSSHLRYDMPGHELESRYYSSDYAKRIEPLLYGATNTARGVKGVSDALHSVRGHFGRHRNIETFDQRNGYGYIKERRY